MENIIVVNNDNLQDYQSKDAIVTISVVKVGDIMPNGIRNILYGFSVKLRGLLGKDLSKVILYGSYARGDFQDNSDVDVMVLVKISPEEIERIEESIFDLAFDIEMEHGIHISPIIKNEEQFEYWVDVLPFYRNVRNEGVGIA